MKYVGKNGVEDECGCAMEQFSAQIEGRPFSVTKDNNPFVGVDNQALCDDLQFSLCLCVGEIIYFGCLYQYLLLVHEVSQNWSLCGSIWGLP